MAIDVKPFVELGEKHKDFVLGLHLEHLHHDGCELEHVACAVLYLAGALDAAQKRLDEYLALIELLNAQLESAKAWIPEWAWADDPAEDEAWAHLGTDGDNKTEWTDTGTFGDNATGITFTGTTSDGNATERTP